MIEEKCIECSVDLDFKVINGLDSIENNSVNWTILSSSPISPSSIHPIQSIDTVSKQVSFRTKVGCINCGKEYWTNSLTRPVPRKCKYCGSIKVRAFKTYQTSIGRDPIIPLNFEEKKVKKRNNGPDETASSQTAKRRGLGFHNLFMNKLAEEFDRHHINDLDVVPLPVDSHRLYKGENHLENLVPIVIQLYPKLFLSHPELFVEFPGIVVGPIL